MYTALYAHTVAKLQTFWPFFFKIICLSCLPLWWFVKMGIYTKLLCKNFQDEMKHCRKYTGNDDDAICLKAFWCRYATTMSILLVGTYTHTHTAQKLLSSLCSLLTWLYLPAHYVLSFLSRKKIIYMQKLAGVSEV